MSELRRRRPWLAVLLAIVISGLGHAYLRRWARAFGWYAAITVVLILFVPEPAVNQLLAQEWPPLMDIAPGLAVVTASVLDAYVLAVRNNRRYEEHKMAHVSTGADSFDEPTKGTSTTSLVDRLSGRSATSVSSPTADDSDDVLGGSASATVECPHCGRETDLTLDFCHWCTESVETTDVH
jgi:hypothetical protein